MNLGTDEEVRGEKVSLPVAQLRVLTDESPANIADEIKFGRGSVDWLQKVYLIDLKSSSLNKDCTSLTGEISVVERNGQTVATPSDDGQAYATKYLLEFYKPLLPFGNNLCKARIKDVLAENATRDKFIVSNRSRAFLDQGIFNTNVSNKAVLYGGIGNLLKVEVGGVQRSLPIEPVGVIVLGIDGLRQDALYAPPGSGSGTEASYDDPQGCGNGRCYVLPIHLNGLCDVLGGKSGLFCDTEGWENRHIKLPDVSAIFPSITFASWASIFTGMTPSATGITGNEFFARGHLWDVVSEMDICR